MTPEKGSFAGRATDLNEQQQKKLCFNNKDFFKILHIYLDTLQETVRWPQSADLLEKPDVEGATYENPTLGNENAEESPLLTTF